MLKIHYQSLSTHSGNHEISDGKNIYKHVPYLIASWLTKGFTSR